MKRSYKVNQLTKLHESCNACGLPTINCICDRAAKIKTEARIWILSSEREFYKPSNTARLLKLVNSESTEIFLWERTKKPKKLIENINDKRYEPYLLFPAEDEDLKRRKVIYNPTGKIPAFILIDGTWKEARRIYRKSDYLKELPIISLEPEYKSRFDIRRGGGEGNLCTIEAAIEVLKINGEIDSSNIINDFYKLFLRSFKAGVSGHKLKE